MTAFAAKSESTETVKAAREAFERLGRIPHELLTKLHNMRFDVLGLEAAWALSVEKN